jgi:hypothetical protein
MTVLGTAICGAVVEEYGAPELLRRLSDPFWFQSLGCVLGMDWHSSGITTSVMGALKRGLNPISRRLGLTICGGRGRHSRHTPEELLALADRTGLDGDALVRASRLSAKVDNTCLQDGFTIYLHCFVVTDRGDWAVVQQGMNPQAAMARRYHWLSEGLRSFVLDPQAAVVGSPQGELLNLSDARAEAAQLSILSFLREPPDRQLREIRHLRMARHHDVRPADVNEKHLGAVLALAYERPLRDFADALLVEGLGPRTLQALALVSEVIFGQPTRFDDPARFAFALGGKDGHPFPVPLSVYDRSIGFLERALDKARLDRSEKMGGMQRLHRLAQEVERSLAPHADVPRLIAKERAESPFYGGMTAAGPARGTRPVKGRNSPGGQLELFGEDSP